MGLIRSFGIRLCLVLLHSALFASYLSPLLDRTSQAQEKPATEVPPAPPNSTTSSGQQSCSLLSDGAIPVKSTIEAKLNMVLESKRQKAGKKLWINSLYQMDLPGCRMLVGAPLYGVVTAASSSNKPGSSELSLAFDAIDCVGHDKQPMKLIVIGVYAPRDEQVRMHNAAPTELQGTGRQISDTAGTTTGYDADLNATSPRGVKPGIVMGYKNLALEPQGGPRCSSKLVTSDPNLVLAPGTILLLVPQTE